MHSYAIFHFFRSWWTIIWNWMANGCPLLLYIFIPGRLASSRLTSHSFFHYVHVNNLKFNGERLSLVVRIYSRTAAGEFEIDQSFILSLCTRADQSNYFVQQLALFFFLWNGRTHVVQALTAGSKRALQVRRAYERQYLEMALYAMNHRLAQKQQKWIMFDTRTTSMQ